ncbi:MAG: DUF3459 domain-containing protein, partial [Proteobacteria bacterium]|nr:DUF3459 domain-containing protein [Pseudomonadota bacterium]
EIGMKGTKAGGTTDANDIPMREPFKWKAVAGAPMSNYQAIATGSVPPAYAANNDGRSVEEQKGVAGSILETYRALIAVRKASPALRRGAYLPVTASNGGIYAFVRSDPGETVLVAINLNSSTTNVTLDLSAFGVPASGTVPVSLENGATLPAITSSNSVAYPLGMAARSWLISRVSLTPPVDRSHADIDGRSLPTDAGSAALLASQTCTSSFGDNVGELNQLFARADGDALRVSISGNIPADTTSLDLFVDVDPGAATGQNVLVTSHLPSPPAGLAPLHGMTFDAGFSPDALYYVNTTGGTTYVDRVSLAGAGTLATKDFRGAGTLNSGRGALTGGVNPNYVEVASDSTNAAGITATSVANAGTATTGFELRIPFADLGLAANFKGRIALAAFLQRTDGTVSNQWLPGLPAASADLGLAPNMNSVPGEQYATVTLGLAGDLNGDGIVAGADLGLLLANWGPVTAEPASRAADLNRDGTIDGADLGTLLSAWGQTTG